MIVEPSGCDPNADPDLGPDPDSDLNPNPDLNPNLDPDPDLNPNLDPNAPLTLARHALEGGRHLDRWTRGV